MNTAAQPTPMHTRPPQGTDRVIARNDFNATDDEFFAGNGRLVRLRPPLPTELVSQVQSIRVIGLVPMIVVHRTSPAATPRPIALAALDAESAKTIIKELVMMGDPKILELLNGVQKAVFAAQIRWWPL